MAIRKIAQIGHPVLRRPNLEVATGYIPDGEVVGLSKFGRIAQRHASRLQVQERFTREVAEEISRVIGSEDVAVAVRGTHLCMSTRGVSMEPARTYIERCQFLTENPPPEEWAGIWEMHEK